MFRRGKRSKWASQAEDQDGEWVPRTDAEAATEAASDLDPRPGNYVSVYRVTAAKEADDVADAYAFHERDRPQILDFVLIPEDRDVSTILRHRVFGFIEWPAPRGPAG